MLGGEKKVKAIRKAKPCAGCGTIIQVGESAVRLTWEDRGIHTELIHPDCREAEIGLNRQYASQDDEWVGLRDMEWEDWDWLLANHPAVAARMGITREKYEEERTESEETRAASRSHDAAASARMEALIAEARRQSGRPAGA